MRYCKVNGGTKLESGTKARSQTKAIDDPKQWKGIKSISILVSFSLLFNYIIIILLHLHIIASECAAAFSGYLFFFFFAVFRGLIKFMSSAESRVRCMNSSISAVENLSLYLYGHLSSLWRRSFRAVWTFGFCRDRLCSFCSFYLYFNTHYICISKSTKTACITLSAHHGAFERVFTNARVNRDSVNQYKKRRKKKLGAHFIMWMCVHGFRMQLWITIQMQPIQME